MLCVMYKTFFIVIYALCLGSESVGQVRWSVLELQEFDQSNVIGKGATQLTATEINALRQLTQHEISECLAYPRLDDPKTTEEGFKSLRVRRINTAPQESPALVVQGFGSCMCGATGNCPFWLLSLRKRPTLLLKTDGIQTFAIQKSRTNARFDLVLGRHDSATEEDLQQYRFDGTRYRLSGCATIEWADRFGNRVNPPRITPHRCRQ